jgi:hypothetical protein
LAAELGKKGRAVLKGIVAFGLTRRAIIVLDASGAPSSVCWLQCLNDMNEVRGCGFGFHAPLFSFRR